MRTPGARLWRLTRARFDQLVECGAFDSDDRVELLDGLLVVREPQGSRHAATVSAARAVLARAFGKGYDVRVGSPVALDDTSEPEPDLAVVKGRPLDYRSAHPARPVLVVEVSETSLVKDRLLKGSLFARAGIEDYWIVNLADAVLEVYRQPVRESARRHGWKYASVRLLRRNVAIAPLAAPRARVRGAALLPRG